MTKTMEEYSSSNFGNSDIYDYQVTEYELTE